MTLRVITDIKYLWTKVLETAVPSMLEYFALHGLTSNMIIETTVKKYLLEQIGTFVPAIIVGTAVPRMVVFMAY